MLFPISLLSLFCPRIFRHHIFELRPEGLDRRELVADGDDAFKATIDFVEVLEDVFEALAVVSRDLIDS